MSKLAVTSIAERFRRAGITFTRTPTVLDTERVDAERIEALINEPNLSVRPATDEEIAAAEAGADHVGDDAASAKSAKPAKAKK